MTGAAFETNRVLLGDALQMLKTIPDGLVQTCITSPPYFGLRDYGVEGQIGLEPTPEAYVQKLVEVFREVKRVLRDDGTLWLNLGDSYNATRDGGHPGGKAQWKPEQEKYQGRSGANVPGLKPKDLIGIPWSVAKALQAPYYTGRIKDEKDRVWLAAMVDAEGSICGTEYQNGDRTKTNIYISITNTAVPIIEKCERLFPQEMKHVYEKSGPSERKCYRWDVERMEQKALFIREIYPHLVAKRKQAILAYTFLEMQKGLASKKKGYLAGQHEQRSLLMSSLSKLNNGIDVDLPDWAIEPPTLFEEGYYLRQDIIWAKPNPMPESVTDRCTKAHEYIFLLAKSQRYYYDAEAIKEKADHPESIHVHKDGNKISDVSDDPLYATKPQRTMGGYETRNRRSVWTITTKPYAEAHFATFPEDLVIPMIKAGSPKDGVVLDPFAGSGTTLAVAEKFGRRWLGMELNPAYLPLINERTAQRTLAV